jgi:tight adherence protein C
MAWIQTFTPQQLIAAAVALVALALLLVGITTLGRALRQGKSQSTVEQALETRDARDDQAAINAASATQGGALRDAMGTAAALGTRWGTGRYGDILLADEDRELIESAGYSDAIRARALFLFSRAVLGLALPLISLLWAGRVTLMGSEAMGIFLLLLAGFALGWMLPKWVVSRRAKARRLAAAEELPLFIDLLRLLQGVGLSIDQSMHVVVHEFRDVMPVLANELALAIEQYARGRTREQSLARIANGFSNEDLSAICRLIAQVDQHGGAVQQPLQQFSERLREQRKLDLKEKIGKLTVKMTGVMVLTLMPALLIVTGGVGFLAIFRAFGQIGGGS